jgi:hypothetical protein
MRATILTRSQTVPQLYPNTTNYEISKSSTFANYSFKDSSQINTDQANNTSASQSDSLNDQSSTQSYNTDSTPDALMQAQVQNSTLTDITSLSEDENAKKTNNQNFKVDIPPRYLTCIGQPVSKSLKEEIIERDQSIQKWIIDMLYLLKDSGIQATVLDQANNVTQTWSNPIPTNNQPVPKHDSEQSIKNETQSTLINLNEVPISTIDSVVCDNKYSTQVKELNVPYDVSAVKTLNMPTAQILKITDSSGNQIDSLIQEKNPAVETAHDLIFEETLDSNEDLPVALYIPRYQFIEQVLEAHKRTLLEAQCEQLLLDVYGYFIQDNSKTKDADLSRTDESLAKHDQKPNQSDEDLIENSQLDKFSHISKHQYPKTVEGNII